ncbi:C-type lectin domain-containing protein [Trichostrongylus colubriformis]|uniref:C-type lectin domain-containing protein n=1 Tax=Trichostrongylus colubriformis TaxID=6319 RepID=A0AAN8F251_TRICO
MALLLLLAALISATGSNNVENYVIHRKTMTWNQAKEFCERRETFLPVIKSEKENELIYQMAMKAMPGGGLRRLWIGLRRNGCSWTWINGTQATYTKWAANQPDNWRQDGDEDCAHMWFGSGAGSHDRHWNDIVCSRADVYVVCQRYF